MATNPEALAERFHAHLSTEIAVPTYNAAPSQAQLTILNDHTDAIVRAAWGFVPEGRWPSRRQTHYQCAGRDGSDGSSGCL